VIAGGLAQAQRLWRNPGIRLTSGTLIGLGSLLWIVSGGQWPSSLAMMTQAEPVAIVLAALLVGATFVLKALRWRLLLAAEGETLLGPLRNILLGHTLNLLLPWRIGDLGRVMRAARGTSLTLDQAAAAWALEKGLDSLVLLGLALVASALAGWLGGSLRWLPMVATAGLVLVALGVARSFPRLARRWSALAMFSGSQGFWRLVGLSLAIWGLAILTNWCILWAYGYLSLRAATVLLLVVMVGIILPGLPGRPGVIEAASLWTLRRWGLLDELALTIGLWIHILALFFPLLWWPLFLALDRSAQLQSAAERPDQQLP
jgi:uncharacterized membrane protein YbhN (UPF0104 family)